MVRENFIVKWYAIFYNPVYFIRRGLYKSVKNLAPLLSGKVLDFGCASKPYQHLFINADSYIGLDIEVSGHPDKNKHADVYYDGKKLPFEDKSFEHVFSSEVFEHVFNLEEILPEISRVTREGGYLLITCPFVGPEHEKPYDFARYTSFGIKHLLEKNGFTVKEQIKTGNFIETLLQMLAIFIYYFLPKKPTVLYLALFQIFILPIFLFALLCNAILPGRIKRKDLYTSNVVLAVKNA